MADATISHVNSGETVELAEYLTGTIPANQAARCGFNAEGADMCSKLG